MRAETVPLYAAEWNAGSGHPPIVLLHGLANRWQAMAPLVPELSRSWHVLAPDLRGHGSSPRAERYTVRLCSADVAALMASRGLAPVVIYGHSLGGLVGLELAARWPSAVRAVIVGDSAVLASRKDSRVVGVPEVVGRLIDPSGRLPKGVDPAVMDAFGDGRLLGDYDGPGVLGRVECPVLLLRGAAHMGAHLNEIDAGRAVSMLAHGRQAEVGGVGHPMQIKSGSAVMTAIRPFLNEMQAGLRATEDAA
jgi:pimeloyl-ACP methyl ester carboxylesterase